MRQAAPEGTHAQFLPCARSKKPDGLATSLDSGVSLAIDDGIEIACSMLSEGQHETHERTPQPTSSERHQAHKIRAHHFRHSAPRWISGRTSNMITIDAPPGELKERIISSILNLVCPQCGGRMSEYQCEGRCGRNWLAEWEWANRAAKSSMSRARR